MRLEVITPQAIVFEGDVSSVVAPLPDGWIGVLAKHSPFVARLMPGQSLIRGPDGDHMIATIGGLIAVKDDLVTLLTGAAALDVTFADLEKSLGSAAEQIQSIEQEAERHFDRIYRTMASTFRPAQRRNI